MPRLRTLRKAATYGSDSAERRVVRVINRAFGPLEGFSQSEVAQNLIRSRNIEGLISAAPWQEVIERAGAVVDPMARQVANSMRDEMRNHQGVSAVLSMDVIDDVSVRYAQQQAGQLIRNINDSQRQAIRAVLGKTLQGDYTVESAARALKQTIGLHPAWADAVKKRRDKEYKKLLDVIRGSKSVLSGDDYAKAFEEAARRVQPYHDQLLRRRALNIARTEVHVSSGLGRLASHSEAVNMKLESKESRREWSAGPGACPICSKMSGEVVKWDAPYSNGSEIAHGHPGCRCADVFLPPNYNDTELDPAPVGWLDPGSTDNSTGSGASRFAFDGLTLAPQLLGGATAAPAVTTASTAEYERAAEALLDEKLTIDAAAKLGPVEHNAAKGLARWTQGQEGMDAIKLGEDADVTDALMGVLKHAPLRTEPLYRGMYVDDDVLDRFVGLRAGDTIPVDHAASFASTRNSAENYLFYDEDEDGLRGVMIKMAKGRSVPVGKRGRSGGESEWLVGNDMVVDSVKQTGEGLWEITVHTN